MDVRFVEVKVSTDELCCTYMTCCYISLYCMYNTVVSGERTWSSNWRCFFWYIYLCSKVQEGSIVPRPSSSVRTIIACDL